MHRRVAAQALRCLAARRGEGGLEQGEAMSIALIVEVMPLLIVGIACIRKSRDHAEPLPFVAGIILTIGSLSLLAVGFLC